MFWCIIILVSIFLGGGRMKFLEALLKRLKDRAFKPCVVYDPDRDMIHVITRGCAVTEVDGIMNVLTLLEASHPMRGGDRDIGFNFFRPDGFVPSTVSWTAMDLWPYIAFWTSWF